MSLSTLRDPQVILTDHTVWSQWFQQLQIRCTTLKIWEQVSPDGNIAPRVEPVQPVEPDVGSFEGRTTLELDDDGNRLIPTNLSELSVNGLKAWREEIEQYKVRLET
jgi:hypothetical protein